MATWFTHQTALLSNTLERDFFSMVRDQRKEAMDEIVNGDRKCLSTWAALPLPKGYPS